MVNIHDVLKAGYITVWSYVLVAQCSTLCDPMDCGPPGSSVVNNPPAGLARDSGSNPGLGPGVLRFMGWQRVGHD